MPGTAVFLTRIAEAIPPLMIQHVSQIGALPQTVIALTVKFEEIPWVSLSNRPELVRVFEGFWHLTIHYGFVEIPDLPSTLRAAKDLGCPVDLDNAVYFGAHDEVVRGEPGGRLLRWRLPLFAFLFRNSVRAVDLFNLPPPNFVEIGRARSRSSRGPRPCTDDLARNQRLGLAAARQVGLRQSRRSILRWNIDPASSRQTESYT